MYRIGATLTGGRSRGVNDVALACVDPDVPATVESDDATRLTVLLCDRGTHTGLPLAGAGHTHPRLLIGPLDQPRAVEAARPGRVNTRPLGRISVPPGPVAPRYLGRARVGGLIQTCTRYTRRRLESTHERWNACCPRRHRRTVHGARHAEPQWMVRSPSLSRQPRPASARPCTVETQQDRAPGDRHPRRAPAPLSACRAAGGALARASARTARRRGRRPGWPSPPAAGT